MLGKLLKIAAWAIGGLLGAFIVLYFIGVAINWNDQEPSPTAIQFSTQYESRSAVADVDNAYVFALGFDASPDSDPVKIGSERQQSIDKPTSTESSSSAGHPFKRPPEVEEFLKSCGLGDRKCPQAFAEADAIFAKWLASDDLLLERYLNLLQRSSWRETIPRDAMGGFPAYTPLLDGQRLLLARVRLLVKSGDYADASALLDRDLKFWRIVQAHSDLLLSKMIAVGAINRHFEWGNLILRGVPLQNVRAAIPAEWLTPFSRADLSMQRVFVGEWIFTSNLITNPNAARSAVDGEFESSFITNTANMLFEPFLQRQDTINQYAARFKLLAAILDVPLDGFEEGCHRAAEFEKTYAKQSSPSNPLYNPVGNVFLGLGGGSLIPYAKRVADIEGVRRATLASSLIRSANIDAGHVAMALLISDLRNPYNNRPFEWNEYTRSVLFVGLEEEARGTHLFTY
ncbi:MAG TPA: hypothetical protein VK629_04520 [Steroidobacteraceae bacterium]|nr:hypothetical protein [Steroidobacteraceae bacterium]